MKRIVSIFLSVLLILMLSGAASAEGELIKTEKDAVEAAEQELEVWKEMGLLCPEVSLEGEPDSIVEIEPRAGAVVGIQKKMDIFGVAILAMTTAVGGGIIRDGILNITPPAAFRNPVFTLSSIVIGIIVFVINRPLEYEPSCGDWR